MKISCKAVHHDEIIATDVQGKDLGTVITRAATDSLYGFTLFCSLVTAADGDERLIERSVDLFQVPYE